MNPRSGTYNPLIVVDLFQEQCLPWSCLTDNLINEVVAESRKLVKTAIKHVADQDTAERIVELTSSALDEHEKKLRDRVQELLLSHKEGHPITYNHYLT